MLLKAGFDGGLLAIKKHKTDSIPEDTQSINWGDSRPHNFAILKDRDKPGVGKRRSQGGGMKLRTLDLLGGGSDPPGSWW